MAKFQPLVILLIIATTIALSDSWRAVGAWNVVTLSDSSAQCGEQSCCDDDEPQPALNSKMADIPLACCEHEGACDCQCCRPFVGLVQLVVKQRRVKDSANPQGYTCDRHIVPRLAWRPDLSRHPPNRHSGIVTSSLLELRCLIIV